MWADGNPNSSLSSGNCSFNNSSDGTLFVTVYSLNILIGIPANLAALYGVCKLMRAQAVQLIYFLNLIVADLLYLLVLPLWIVYFIQDHSWTLGPLACKVCGAMYFVNIYASIYFLCCIAIDRFMGIVYPMRFQAWQNVRCHVGVSLAGWLLIILCQVPVILALDFDHYDLCYEGFVSDRLHAVFICIVASFGFLGPLLILLVSCQASLRGIGRASLSPGSAVWIKILLLVCFLTFISCFGPYHCVSLVRAVHLLIFGLDCSFLLSIHSYYRVSMAMMSLNTLLDPLLYVLLSKDIQKVVKSLCCWKHFSP
ncbi:ovarian cancer G-protein coupled receptor 1-like isoform X1 [Hyla sarda]|uniref:ovarian cancer G-protein coupled receptor 1-like isoform X1 n=1 Tax=Hyla sarda TaxID=327740 RepID=UPI0024C306F6|nr:ovarian cancer G-protein coupled receptor 1-like isoform X1 [Hyla sarda]XP_056401615.1 ovarian cancer G-protein coupled receptor 1-like isoform X1 [Hyla sarda]